MNEMQKCMYIYCCIIQDTNYVERYRDAEVDSKLIENSLTGNLYHKLTCAGIALTFKELLDRQDIECEYLSKTNSHAFNRVIIDGKKYGMDLTWDLNRYEHDGKISFDYFGRQKTEKFYYKYHDLCYEEDETMDEIDAFTQEEIDNCYNSIKSKLDSREKHEEIISKLTKEEKIKTLQILHTYSELQKEEAYIELIRFLKRNKLIEENDFRVLFAQHRFSLVGDIVGTNISKLENIEAIKDFYYKKNHSENFIEAAKKDIAQYLESYIRSFFDMTFIYVDTFKYVPFEENEELNIFYYNIKSKIEYFTSIRDIIVKMGYEEELNYFIYKLQKEEEKVREEKIGKRGVQSQYDRDYGYLSSVISPAEMLYIKEFIDKKNNTEMSIDEFKNYFTNPSFMRTIFDREWKFTDAELQKLLIEVYEKNILQMIEIMKKRKEISGVEEIEKTDSFRKLSSEEDDFAWGPINFDENFKNMKFR